MKKPSFWTATGLAAAVVAAVFVVPFSRDGHAVAAATILQSLRESAHRGLRVRISNVETDEFKADVRVDVTFPEPISLSRLLEEGDVHHAQPDGVYVECAVEMGTLDEELAGLNADITLAMKDDEQWAFMKVNKIPESILEDAPFLVAFQPMLQNGLFLDLAGIDELIADPEIAAEIHSEIAAAHGEHHHVHESRHERTLQIGLTTSTGDKSVMDIHVQSEAEEEPAGGTGEDAAPLSKDAEAHARMIQSLLMGQMDETQVQQLIKDLENYAQSVTLEDRGSDTWVLRAAEFKMGELEFDDQHRQLFGNAVLNVTYTEGEGVREVEVTGVGSAAGRIAFEFIEEIDPTLLDRQRFTSLGVPILNVGALAQMAVTHGGDTAAPSEDESSIR